MNRCTQLYDSALQVLMILFRAWFVIAVLSTRICWGHFGARTASETLRRLHTLEIQHPSCLLMHRRLAAVFCTTTRMILGKGFVTALDRRNGTNCGTLAWKERRSRTRVQLVHHDMLPAKVRSYQLPRCRVQLRHLRQHWNGEWMLSFCHQPTTNGTVNLFCALVPENSQQSGTLYSPVISTCTDSPLETFIVFFALPRCYLTSVHFYWFVLNNLTFDFINLQFLQFAAHVVIFPFFFVGSGILPLRNESITYLLILSCCYIYDMTWVTSCSSSASVNIGIGIILIIIAL